MADSISLDVKGLNMSYKKHTIFSDADLTLSGGDVVALVGKNGCGKSTFLNVLAGLLKADGGTITIRVNEEEIPINRFQEYVSYVPQNNYLMESLSCYDNLLFWYQGDKAKLKKDIESGFIKELGIDSYINKRISKLSGGMKKRVAIACGLASNPKVLLLDEVNASLDIMCKLQIQKLIASYASKGNIVILVTHEEGDLDVCNKTYLVENLKFNKVECNSLKELFVGES